MSRFKNNLSWFQNCPQIHSRKIFSGRDTRQGWEGARLVQCRHVHQVMGLPDVRVHQDDAWPRPQREQRVLPPHR